MSVCNFAQTIYIVHYILANIYIKLLSNKPKRKGIVNFRLEMMMEGKKKRREQIYKSEEVEKVRCAEEVMKNGKTEQNVEINLFGIAASIKLFE